MLKLIGLAALAATLFLVPAASPGLTTIQPQAGVAAVAVAAPHAPEKTASEFGLDVQHGHDHASGLAPGQTPEDFKAWLRRSPANRDGLLAFRNYLAAQGLE